MCFLHIFHFSDVSNITRYRITFSVILLLEEFVAEYKVCKLFYHGFKFSLEDIDIIISSVLLISVIKYA